MTDQVIFEARPRWVDAWDTEHYLLVQPKKRKFLTQAPWSNYPLKLEKKKKTTSGWLSFDVCVLIPSAGKTQSKTSLVLKLAEPLLQQHSHKCQTHDKEGTNPIHNCFLKNGLVGAHGLLCSAFLPPSLCLVPLRSLASAARRLN